MELKELVFDKLKNIEICKGIENLYDVLTYSPDVKNGDISLPCFPFAKALHKNPLEIADEIVNNFNDEIVERVENVRGYVNFYLNRKKECI